mgnify:CR=1 FL=1
METLLSKEGLEQRFKISCDYMFYNGLRAAIPRSWLDKIQAAKNEEIKCIVLDENLPLLVMLKNRLIDIKKATCSQLYSVEIEKIVQRPTCYFKWESEYYFANFEWDLINVIPYECTTETYLQSLQFKIIHRYFPCNYHLHLWKIIDSNRCTYCNATDTLSHYFAECEAVRTFWISLKAWFLRIFEFSINFTALDVLLGVTNAGKSNDITFKI